MAARRPISHPLPTSHRPVLQPPIASAEYCLRASAYPARYRVFLSRKSNTICPLFRCSFDSASGRCRSGRSGRSRRHPGGPGPTRLVFYSHVPADRISRKNGLTQLNRRPLSPCLWYDGVMSRLAVELSGPLLAVVSVVVAWFALWPVAISLMAVAVFLSFVCRPGAQGGRGEN